MRTPGVTSYRSLSPGRQALIIAIVLGLTVGLVVAPFAYDAAIEPAPDQIAVVPIVGTIDGQNAAEVSQRLTEARFDTSVQAVVLVIDSPGGLATAGEEIYMQVDRTAQEKPVIAVSNVVAASAGYKAAVPADEILVKANTIVGSVGTIFVRPNPVEPSEPVIHTGPRKLDGDTPRGYEHQVEMSGAMFRDVVMEERGDKLVLDEEELAHARVYNGIEAVEYGLADNISDLQGAIQAAADRADLDTFEIKTMEYGTEVRFLDQTNYAHATQDNKTKIGMEQLVDTQDDRILPQVLMLPHAAVATDLEEQAPAPVENSTTTDAEAADE